MPRIHNHGDKEYSVANLVYRKRARIAIRYMKLYLWKGIQRLNIVNVGHNIGPGVVSLFRKLTHLDLTASMARKGLDLTLMEIARMGNLVSLNVADNDIGSDAYATDALGHAILNNYETLAYINISGNSITVDWDMASCLSCCSSVHTMIASGNSFDCGDTRYWFLAQMDRLMRLELRSCGIDTERAASLAQALGECANLAHLDLQGNPLGEVGMRLIAGALRESESMKCLIFDQPVKPSDEFMEEIKEMLPGLFIRF
jgi:Ran GTPase-activating protein (RanGAP) involved in mRNA processing and transport